MLLAGSGEARVIAGKLAETGQIQVTASLLSPPRSFGPLPVRTRLGRFDGNDGQAQYLREQGVTAVLDASHPFAARISAQIALVCADLGLPHAQVLRPKWYPVAGDHWQEVADESKVAGLLTPKQRVFTTTGRARLDVLTRDSSAQFFVRKLENHMDDLDQPDLGDPDLGQPNVHYITGKGPFSVEDEIRTLRGLKIDVLLVKNSGGLPSRTKLDAARALGIKVILIARPPLLDVRRLETVKAAMDWIDSV